MNAPSWMKPHLRQRLEQERAEKERTGPVNGEKALVADEKGRIKEVVTDHKPMPPKDLPPLPPKNGLDWKEIEQSIGNIEFAELIAQQLRAHQEEVLRILGLTSGKKRMSWRELQENQE